MRRTLGPSLMVVLLGMVTSSCLKPQQAAPAAKSSPTVADTPPPTQMEAFKPAAGSVTTFGYDDLGTVGTVSVDVREMRSTNGGSVRGLLVDVRESEYRKERSFVDSDEIPELIKGFDALLQIYSNPTKFKSFEVRYATRGQLELIAFNNSRGNINYSVKAGRVVGASAFLDANGMQQLRGLFVSAMQKLESLNGK